MEVPFLRFSSVSNLDDHVSIIDQIKVPLVWKRGDDIEISFNVEAKSFVHLSLGWFTFPLIGIDEIPLLIDLILLSVHTNVSVLLINSTLNFQDLSFLIDK